MSQKLKWTILKVPGKKDLYDVSADGTITLELDSETLKKLKKYDCIIDYAIDFKFKDVTAESGEDFELVENSKIQLDVS